MTDLPGISLGSLRTRMCAGLDGLASLREDWLRLARGSEHYFHDYHWFVEWVRHDPELPLGLHFCVVADEAGEVIGIVPLQARVERIRRLPFRVWTLLGSTGGDVMLFASGADFLCRSEAEAPRVLEAALSHLAEVRPRRYLLQLGRLTSGSRALGAATGRPEGFVYTRGATSRISTDRPFEAVCSGLSRNMKANLRRFTSRARAEGEISFRVDRPDAAGFEEAYEDFKRVEASGWKARAKSGGALTTNRQDNQRRFLEAMFCAPENQCKPLIFRIILNGECVAGLIGIHHGRTLAALKIGYLDARKRLGAGHLLVHDVLRYSCDHPDIEWVDMLSDAPWLKPWKPTVRPHHWVYLSLGGLGQIALRLLRIRRF
jgi:CelD/BcsL family acetyltransferase involved in cellulose biosynthesis